MRRSATLACLLALAAFGTVTATASVAGEGEQVGYRIDGEEVVFEFDREDYESVSSGDTGERLMMEQVMLSSSNVVAVAGEFNGWSTDAWVMSCGKPGTYELRRPLSEFVGRELWPFKFVIDGVLWVEPPRAAPNIQPTGLGNDSYNLLLGVPATYAEPAPFDSALLERLISPTDAMDGACSLKPVDSAVGATPIPVFSNPMITADRRVVGFVSVFVMPPTPEEEASWEAEALEESPGGFLGGVEELIEQRIANVRAALVVIYQSATGAETGVFALEFIEPLSAERQAELAADGPGGSVVVGDHVAAAVWTDDRERGCLEAVLGHVSAVLAD